MSSFLLNSFSKISPFFVSENYLISPYVLKYRLDSHFISAYWRHNSLPFGFHHCCWKVKCYSVVSNVSSLCILLKSFCFFGVLQLWLDMDFFFLFSLVGFGFAGSLIFNTSGKFPATILTNDISSLFCYVTLE